MLSATASTFATAFTTSSNSRANVPSAILPKVTPSYRLISSANTASTTTLSTPKLATIASTSEINSVTNTSPWFLQTTILYIGLLTYTQHALLAVGICLSANEVPRIAQMFGLDTSVRVNMMSVSSTVSLGSRVAKAFTKK